MKRVFLLLLMAALLLTACGSHEIMVDTEARTFSDGTYTYPYEDETIQNDYGTFRTITITYPNGGKYIWEFHSRSSANGYTSGATHRTSGSYDSASYTNGETLIDKLMNPDPSEEPFEWKLTAGDIQCIIMGIILCALGIWQAACPRQSWYVAHGWMYKDAEPSDLALSLSKGFGTFFAVIGVLLLIFGIF